MANEGVKRNLAAVLHAAKQSARELTERASNDKWSTVSALTGSTAVGDVVPGCRKLTPQEIERLREIKNEFATRTQAALKRVFVQRKSN